MSNCDNIRIFISNQAVGIEGNAISATIVGVNPTKGTISGLDINQIIAADSSAEGKAVSSSGSNGWVEGEIQVKLMWGATSQVLKLTYQGEKQPWGRDCLPHPLGDQTDYFYATVSSTPGEHEACTQTFLIESIQQVTERLRAAG